MSLQLIKTKQGRKRFLKSEPMKDLINWMELLSELKNFLSIESSFQIVGNSVYFEMSPKISDPVMMLEVIGPAVVDQNGLVLMDLESGESLIHKLQGHDLFSFDFDQLLLSSKELMRTLELNFKKKNDELSPFFHIVFNHDKIELHFFRQKDYIQK